TAPMRKKKGKGIVPMALSFLERACDMSNPDTGCYELAEALMSGTYVARDAKRGGELAVRLCDAGKPTCRLAGDAFEHGLGAPQDATKAVAAYTKACSASDGRACQELARLTRIGKGTKKDPAEADRLIQRAEEPTDDED
ncbi:MAG: Sel1 domain repeat-containing protein, partial [Labilithrix sp.]|nr:Sel1 domain repeat-containing protein [Labilithrix sp.]